MLYFDFFFCHCSIFFRFLISNGLVLLFADIGSEKQNRHNSKYILIKKLHAYYQNHNKINILVLYVTFQNFDSLKWFWQIIPCQQTFTLEWLLGCVYTAILKNTQTLKMYFTKFKQILPHQWYILHTFLWKSSSSL